MKLKLQTALLAILLATTVTAPSTGAPTAQITTRELLRHSDVPASDLETRLYLITVPPGTAVPSHSHPVVGIGYIVSGMAESRFEGRSLETLFAGQSFADLADVRHVVFRNPDATQPLVFLVAYTVSQNSEVTVFDAPASGDRP